MGDRAHCVADVIEVFNVKIELPKSAAHVRAARGVCECRRGTGSHYEPTYD